MPIQAQLKMIKEFTPEFLLNEIRQDRDLFNKILVLGNISIITQNIFQYYLLDSKAGGNDKGPLCLLDAMFLTGSLILVGKNDGLNNKFTLYFPNHPQNSYNFGKAVLVFENSNGTLSSDVDSLLSKFDSLFVSSFLPPLLSSGTPSNEEIIFYEDYFYQIKSMLKKLKNSGNYSVLWNDFIILLKNFAANYNNRNQLITFTLSKSPSNIEITINVQGQSCLYLTITQDERPNETSQYQKIMERYIPSQETTTLTKQSCLNASIIEHMIKTDKEKTKVTSDPNYLYLGRPLHGNFLHKFPKIIVLDPNNVKVNYGFYPNGKDLYVAIRCDDSFPTITKDEILCKYGKEILEIKFQRVLNKQKMQQEQIFIFEFDNTLLPASLSLSINNIPLLERQFSLQTDIFRVEADWQTKKYRVMVKKDNSIACSLNLLQNDLLENGEQQYYTNFPLLSTIPYVWEDISENDVNKAINMPQIPTDDPEYCLLFERDYQKQYLLSLEKKEYAKPDLELQGQIQTETYVAQFWDSTSCPEYFKKSFYKKNVSIHDDGKLIKNAVLTDKDKLAVAMKKNDSSMEFLRMAIYDPQEKPGAVANEI